jgi:pimeloyl-ACP methyl ester carboxylesterase
VRLIRGGIALLAVLLTGLLVLAGCGAPGEQRPPGRGTPPVSTQEPPQNAQACTVSADEDDDEEAENKRGDDRCAELFTAAPGATLTVYRNYPLSGNTGVTAAVVVVHGTGRNASGYFGRMLEAARLAGAAEHTLVVAPWFQTEDDSDGASARWSSGGWKIGDDSVEPGGLSSFTAMDQLLNQLADRSRFPNLTRITVAGHSAGGQFVQRYAATGRAPTQLTGIAFHFVVANPSSYLYPVPERPNRSGTEMVQPDRCSSYNEYKYGLEGTPPYLRGLTAQQVLGNLSTRRVTYLLGASDTEKDNELDTDCAARLQGKNRFQRGTYFFDWIHRTYPDAPSDRIVVPDTAHESDEMFQSAQARPVLFG